MVIYIRPNFTRDQENNTKHFWNRVPFANQLRNNDWIRACWKSREDKRDDLEDMCSNQRVRYRVAEEYAYYFKDHQQKKFCHTANKITVSNHSEASCICEGLKNSFPRSCKPQFEGTVPASEESCHTFNRAAYIGICFLSSYSKAR